MVVYCIKFVLRGESPRDYVDLLRSLKFPPSITISDIPHRLAAHANHTIPQFFRPNEGRLFPPSAGNIDAAKEGRLVRHLPWVQGATVPRAFRFGFDANEDEMHPVTGVSERYSLCDRFHERNSSSPDDLLRRVTLVPELNAIINTEVEEQLHNSMNRSNYAFNMMLPGNHLFMMRLKIHTSNVRINEVYRIKLQEAVRAHTGPNRILMHDSQGILLLQSTFEMKDLPGDIEKAESSSGTDASNTDSKNDDIRVTQSSKRMASDKVNPLI